MPFGQRNVDTYIRNICKWHLGGEQDCRRQRRQYTSENLGGKYSVSKYTEASPVQIYKLVSCRRGRTTIHPALSVFYVCIVLKTAHTVYNQNF